MRWSHFKDDAYDFTQGKTDKQLWIPLTDRLAAYLKTVKKQGVNVVSDRQGRPVRYHAVAEEMRKVKAGMMHPDAAKCVTHGLRKNATMELYQSGCDDKMVKAVTGPSGVEMLKKYGGRVRQKALATKVQKARSRMEWNKTGTLKFQTLF
jgi:integrase